MGKFAIKWFQATKDNAALLDSIRALGERNDLWTLVGLGLEKHCSIPCESNTDSPTKLYNSTESEARQYIAEFTQRNSIASSKEQAQSQVHLASITYKDWKMDRESDSKRKAGAGLQRFLCTIGDFLTSFSGVAEIVKAADQQFGGLAYGTVALLATVAILKQRREDTIETTLEELSHAFPRLSTLQELQPTQQLERLIVSVFELSIIFCRETILYFTKSSRILEVMKPSSTKSETVSKLRLKLLEVRKECEILMLQKLEDMRLQLQNVNLQLEETNARLEVMSNTSKSIEATGLDTNLRVQENQLRLRQAAELKAKNKSLLKLRRQLNFTKAEEQDVLNVASKVKTLLANEFSQHRRKARGVPQLLSAGLLTQDETFDSWFKSKHSTILILAGCNFEDPASIHLNWLSSASVWAAENMRQTNHVLAVFCQTNYTVTDRIRRTFSSIVKSLIYQLAEHHSIGLHAQQELVREKLALPEHDDEDHMLDLLSSLMQQFPVNECIVLIIDRLDQCRLSNKPHADAEDIHNAVSSLLQMLRNQTSPHPQLKILLVMDETAARDIPKIFSWAVNERLLSCRVDWDQQIDEE